MSFGCLHQFDECNVIFVSRYFEENYFRPKVRLPKLSVTNLENI